MFDHCVGLHGMLPILAGDVVDVSELSQRVQSGDSRKGITVVKLDLVVTPWVIAGESDFYRFVLLEELPDGTFMELWRDEGRLASGDFTIVGVE